MKKITQCFLEGESLTSNTNKPELIILKSRNKTIMKHLNFCISSQKIQPTSQVKYLGVTLQDDSHCNTFGEPKEETKS